MKLQFIKSPLILVLILAITATSCLKDKAFKNGSIQSGSGGSGTNTELISIGLTVSSTSNFLVAAYDNSNNDTTIDLIPVELGGLSAAAQDIHVTLTPNSALIDAYNTANGTSYTFAPSTVYTALNGGVVTIPKGKRTGFLQIKFKPSDFLGVTYAWGFTISKVTEACYTISGNLNNGIVAIAIKNQWDGDYVVTGWFFHPAAGRVIPGIMKHLSTTSATGLGGGVGDLGAPFTFDVINNQLVNWSSGGFVASGFMTADNPGGKDYSSPTNGGHLPGDANYNITIYNNTYDPATKTFYMHYGYCNGGCTSSSDQTGYSRQIYEKWVRK